MAQKKKATRAKTKKSAPSSPHSVVWFEIPADDLSRAKSFYGKLFGWNIQAFPNMADYWHIDTGGADASPDGGMMPRMHPRQEITAYISVPSVTRFMAKVEKLGGEVCIPKKPVPGMGYLAICRDSEGNAFALWEPNSRAK